VRVSEPGSHHNDARSRTGSAGCRAATLTSRIGWRRRWLLFDLTFVIAFGVAASEFAHMLLTGHIDG
jgi:hypothetical protein